MGQNQFLETLQAIAGMLDEAKRLREVGAYEAINADRLARNKLAAVIAHLIAAS